MFTISDEAQDLKSFFLRFGIKVEFIEGYQSPQEFRFLFSGGAYTDSALKKAMSILNNMDGYSYEKNMHDGGFTVTRPRKKRKFISAGDCVSSIKNSISADSDGNQKGYISFGKGNKDYIVTNLDECSHILIAGTTGSGKSCLLNSLICEILCFSDSNLVLIDPKSGAEFGLYEQDVHNRIEQVCKDTKTALRWLNICVHEMEKRYKTMQAQGLKKWNGRRIVIVIDELADLMMTSKKESEDLIVRIAQKGRAAGIHLIVATQDPRASVVTGLIKYNLPTKVCLTTANARHSMNVIDCGNAANLLGKGDSLIKLPSSVELHRCQCASITDREIIDLLTGKNDKK